MKGRGRSFGGPLFLRATLPEEPRRNKEQRDKCGLDNRANRRNPNVGNGFGIKKDFQESGNEDSEWILWESGVTTIP